MKYNFFSILFMMLVGMSVSFSQVYENVYQNSDNEVRTKLDQNKIAGIDILTGVVAQHNLGISGVDISKKVELESLFTKHSLITNFTFSEDLTSLILETSAHLTKDEITSLLNPLNLILTGYTVVYSINE